MADGMDLDFRICFTFNNAEFMRDFNYTVNVLVKAYFNDELAHSFCSACAVGNIVADAIGTKPKRLTDGTVEFDNNYFEDGTRTTWYNVMHASDPYGEMQIAKTGYSIFEMRIIEDAFESAPGKPKKDGVWYGKQTDPVWMFNGLMAVVDVLAEIHGVDLEVKESAKLLFVK